NMGLRKAVDLLRDGRPKQHVAAVHRQHPRQGGPPGACAQNTNLSCHHAASLCAVVISCRVLSIVPQKGGPRQAARRPPPSFQTIQAISRAPPRMTTTHIPDTQRGCSYT